MSESPQYRVPALEKGLDILEALASVATPLSLVELASKLNRSSSELFRMLNCLEVRGYVRRDEVSGKFSLTLRMFTLAHAHSVADKLMEAARRPMQELTETFRESCHLSIIDNGQLIVLVQQESPEQVRLSIEVGGVFDPAQTGSGRLLLAHMSPERRTEVLARSPSMADAKSAETQNLLSRLEAIRSAGLSVAESETIEGVRDLAVLVGEARTGVTAALAVTRLIRRNGRGEEDALVEGMKRAAAKVTENLGLTLAS